MENIIGQKFNRLTIIEVLEKKVPNSTRRCIAICDCGKQKEFALKHVRYGRTVSCGCAYGKSRIIHGLSKSSISSTIKNIINRCYNPNCYQYSNYGGRGIKVCDEWKNDRLKFFEWAKTNGYKKGLQIDRIDNDGNYEPNNCRFVVPKINANNKRNNLLISFNGKTKTASEWANESGVRGSIIAQRINCGWQPKDAIFTKVKKASRLIDYNGHTKSLTEWANEYGIKVDTLFKRLAMGWPMEKALIKPSKI